HRQRHPRSPAPALRDFHAGAGEAVVEGHRNQPVPAAGRKISLIPPTLWDCFSRELLPLPLRRQGEAGRGCSRFAVIRTTPLPNPPLPSQGRAQALAAETAPTGLQAAGLNRAAVPTLPTRGHA